MFIFRRRFNFICLCFKNCWNFCAQVDFIHISSSLFLIYSWSCYGIQLLILVYSCQLRLIKQVRKTDVRAVSHTIFTASSRERRKDAALCYATRHDATGGGFLIAGAHCGFLPSCRIGISTTSRALTKDWCPQRLALWNKSEHATDEERGCVIARENERADSGSLAPDVDRNERERRGRRENGRDGGGRKLELCVFLCPLVDKSGSETMREWRKRRESEEKKGEKVGGKKREGEAHCGNKRHRRGILSIGSFGLLLTGIRALMRDPSLVGPESPTISL